MNRRLNKMLNAVTASLLSMLGFSACSNSSGGDEPCLYGSPTTDYHFKGTVTDEQGAPIKGIKVVSQMKHGDVTYRLDSTYTDSNGAYQTADQHSASTVDYFLKNKQLSVSFEDVDGEENGGEFETAKTESDDVGVKQIEKGDGVWYKGKYELTADKKLKKK